MELFMNRLNKSVQIDPKFSWTDWELYDMPGSVGAAEQLNEVLRQAVNEGMPRCVVAEAVEDVMTKFRKFGALDTEPRAFLGEVLDEIFQ